MVVKIIKHASEFILAINLFIHAHLRVFKQLVQALLLGLQVIFCRVLSETSSP